MTKLKGVVVFYIDVGHLPPEKADSFLQKTKERNAEFLKLLPKNITTIWMPVRPPALTRVEFLPLA